MSSLTQESSLTHQIQYLDRKLAQLQTLNRRFSWYRLAAFLGGVAGVWLTISFTEDAWGWLAALVGILLFFSVVYFHRRLDSWITKLEVRKSLASRQLARFRLEWDNLTSPDLPEDWQRSALDIDLDLTGERSLHHLIDSSVTKGGARRLAKWLTAGEPDLQRLRYRQQLVKALAPMKRFRRRLLLNYHLAARERLDEEQLTAWLGVDYPSKRLQWTLPIAALLATLNLTLFLLNSLGLFPPLWPFSMSFYLVFYLANASQTAPLLDAVVRLDTEIAKLSVLLRYLENAPLSSKPDTHSKALSRLLAPFRETQNRPSKQLRRIKIITAAIGLRMNPIMGLALNLFLPWDFAWARLAANARGAMETALPLWLERLHQLEALCSLAGFANLHPEHAFPEITDHVEPVLEVRGISHPLLPKRGKVRNDFKLEEIGQVAIITGSNMAGKSTFIKTIGINLCLAYAGSVVDALLLKARPLRLHTCIRISDSISDGFSYFYAEVKCLKGLLDKLTADDSRPLLYLIDEIFRGTNNRERLIGSRAYLQSVLGLNGLGLLATHDLELAGLADDSTLANNFHFRDQVQEGKLVFDYTIRSGPSPTTNALRIMALEGLPTGETFNMPEAP